jgi:hypothetical protein
MRLLTTVIAAAALAVPSAAQQSLQKPGAQSGGDQRRDLQG